MWDRRAEYLSNHDGDTLKVNLDQGFGDIKLADIRLLGVYAPELAEPGGKECREFVQEWFTRNKIAGRRWSYIVTTARMKVADSEQRTLNRYVGTVTSLDGSRNLNLEVMNFIIAKGYAGGTGSR